MQYLAMPSNDIRRNLATEQHLMNSDHMQVPFMLFYIEDSCIIVGRNQNTLAPLSHTQQPPYSGLSLCHSSNPL